MSILECCPQPGVKPGFPVDSLSGNCRGHVAVYGQTSCSGDCGICSTLPRHTLQRGPGKKTVTPSPQSNQGVPREVKARELDWIVFRKLSKLTGNTTGVRQPDCRDVKLSLTLQSYKSMRTGTGAQVARKQKQISRSFCLLCSSSYRTLRQRLACVSSGPFSVSLPARPWRVTSRSAFDRAERARSKTPLPDTSSKTGAAKQCCHQLAWYSLLVQ